VAVPQLLVPARIFPVVVSQLLASPNRMLQMADLLLDRATDLLKMASSVRVSVGTLRLSPKENRELD